MVKEQFAETFNANITAWNDDWVYAPSEYDSMLRVEDTTQWFEQSFGISGVPRPTIRRDQQPFTQVSPVKGYGNVIRLLQYGSQLTIEESAIRYSKHKEAFSQAVSMLESAKTVMNVVGINLYNNGFTAQPDDFIEADGTQRAFFSTAHRLEDNSGSYSNYFNVIVPPNSDTLYSVLSVYLGLLKGNAGDYIDVGNDFTIETPMNSPEYRKAADQLVMSPDNPETTNRAVNTVRKSFQLSHSPSRYLTSSTKWFVRVPTSWRQFPLVMKIGKRPMLEPLAPVGPINPTAMVTSLMLDFGVGKRYSPRGVVAIGG